MNHYVAIFKTALQDFLDDDCMSSGAAIAYYTTFSLPPLLTFVLLVTTWFGYSEQQVTSSIKRDIGLSLSEQSGKGADAPQSGSDSKSPPGNTDSDLPLGLGNLGLLSKLIGVGLLLFAASGVFGQLQYSLDKAWEVKPDPKQGGIWTFLTKRILSVGIVVVIGFFLLVSMVITTVLDEILNWVTRGSIEGQVLGFLLNESASLVIVAALFAIMFKVLPDAEIAWRDVWGGAICTAVLFVAGKFVIGWYLDNSHVGADWGTSAASVIGTLVWVYYSSLIVLFGAEVTQAWANRLGSGSKPKAGAIRVVTEEQRIEQGSVAR